MTAKKSYTTPIWWIGFVILVKVLLTLAVLYTFIGVMKTRSELTYDYYRDLIKNELISQGIFLIILATEAIIYWRIRRRIMRKDFVWVHIGGLLLAFVGAPIGFTLFTAWQSMTNGAGDAGSKITIANNIRTYLVWAALIIGHIGFVLVLISANKKRSDELRSTTTNGPDILNDYA